jgi:hypothetical protein
MASIARAHTDRARWGKKPGPQAPRHRPDLGHGHLRGLGEPDGSPQQQDRADEDGDARPGEGLDARSQVVAEHREVVQRGVDDGLLGGVVVTEDPAGDRHEHQQEGEDRQHPVVAHHRGEEAELVLTALLQDASDEGGRGDPLLHAIEDAQGPVPDVVRRRWHRDEGPFGRRVRGLRRRRVRLVLRHGHPASVPTWGAQLSA